MLSHFIHMNRNPFALFEALDRQLDRDYRSARDFPIEAYPTVNAYDSGNEFVVVADVPGMRDADLHITLLEETLTVSGERKVGAPEGYTAIRRERPSLQFSRTIPLPNKVDAEKVVAEVRDGVLTIRLPKAPAAQSRTIEVRAS